MLQRGMWQIAAQGRKVAPVGSAAADRRDLAALSCCQQNEAQGSVAPTVSIMPAAPKTTNSVQKRL